MQLYRALLALSLAGSTFAAYGPPIRRRDNATLPTQEPSPVINQYILEFAENANYDEILAEISKRPNTKVLKKYDSSVFRGVAVESISESPESLQASPKIANAWQSHLVKLMPTMEPGDGVDPKNYSVHAMTGVDRLHAQGLYGKGVKVAIVDTGVDYTHPALGGGLGSGFKVAAGRDYLGDTYWPDEPAKPDDDPMDTAGHGTHVAGIVAGNGNWFKGVAPEATILSYKVFGLGPYTDESILIQAFLDAYEDGADIITASVGDYSNWSQNPWAIVASRLVEEGVVITIAAGNDGEEGPFRGSTGSSGLNVLAVASVDPSDIVAIPIVATFTEDGETDTHELAYRPGSVIFPFDIQNAPVYALTLNTSVLDDACLALPEDTPDLSGKVVLVRQSLLCEDWQQSDNVAPFNPAGIIFYHNLDVDYLDPWSYNWFPVGVVTDAAGALMIETLANGGEVTLNFAEIDKYVVMPYQWGGTGSFWTSWGGLWDLTLKPDIAAPGAAITSTYLDGNYATLSGTSMATPYIAGIAALYISKFGGREKHGKGFAKMLHARIQSSGASMAWPGNTADGGSHLASPSQVGNGLVNAWKVMEYDTQLSLTKFSLNDTLHFSRYQKVDITNNGDKEVTYTFGVEAAGSYDALYGETEGPWAPAVRFIQLIKMYSLKPGVTFPAGGTFKVKPGQTRKAEFTFKLPQLTDGHLTSQLPVYSGKIMIYGSNGEQLSVPYYGVLADVKKEIRQHGVFWKGIGYPHLTLPTFPVPATAWEKPYWSFETAESEPDWPMLNIANIWGSQELRWDIFDPNWPERYWKYPLVEGKNGYIGSATYFRGSRATWFDEEKDDPNDVLNFPEMYLQRQYSHVFIWLGQLANGSVIVPGNYTMRIAILLPFGERQRSDNWEIMSLPQIQILPKTIKVQ